MASMRARELLYQVGTTITIFPHVPPTLASVKARDYAAEEHPAGGSSHPRGVPWCLMPPPHESHAKRDTGCPNLEIVQQIAVGHDRAQVVVCKVVLRAGQPAVRLVAKIYDPRLYGKTDSGLANNFPAQDVEDSDLEYCRETSAYERIEANKSTRPYPCTPDYFGSWSFQITQMGTSQGQKSPKQKKICLILIEHIQGSSIDRYTSPEAKTLLGDAYRLYVCARYCECEIWLQHIGIHHRDEELRNIMLIPAPDLAGTRTTQLQTPRVALIDFGVAFVTTESSDNGADKDPHPESPIVHFWSEYSQIFSWCPRWFICDLPKRRKWLIAEFGGSDRYRKIEETLRPDELSSWDEAWLRDLENERG